MKERGEGGEQKVEGDERGRRKKRGGDERGERGRLKGRWVRGWGGESNHPDYFPLST